MADKLMYIPIDGTQNYNQLIEATNQNSLKFPKFQRIRKHCYKTLGSSVINSPLPPLSL